MAWIKNRKGVWRISILVLLGVALLGPWTFDLIWVPSEYSCSAPNIRLDEDYCGIPLSGIWLFRWMVGGFIYVTTELVTRAISFGDWTREFLFGLLLFLPILPIFSTLHLILRGDHRFRRKFNITAWILAFSTVLLIAISSYPKLFYVLWGVWLYTALAISALILEMLVLNTETIDPSKP